MGAEWRPDSRRPVLYYSFTVTPGSQGYYSLVISNPYDPLQFTTVNFGYLAVDLPSQIYHTQLLAGGPAGFQDGTGGAAKFDAPSGLAVDGSGNVFVADTGNNAIRMISPSGVTTTVAGQASAGKLDGTGSSAEFNDPKELPPTRPATCLWRTPTITRYE